MKTYRLKPLTLAIALAVPFTAHAQLPVLNQVTHGSATVNPSAGNPNGLTVNQTGNRAVIQWNSFNIGQSNSVHFQNGQGATLNIVDNGSSEIAGALSATGSVYLINPHGITVTASGSVNTGGAFVASTLSVLNAASFMNESLNSFTFQGQGGAISNAGNITARDVVLLGSRVDNAGTLLAQQGRVALGSASHATLDLSGDGFLQVLAPATVTGDDALLTNSGSITANGGLVQLSAATAREAVREAIHMPGTVRARGVSGVDGAIRFHGGAGGTLNVTGDLDTRPDDGDSSGGSVELIGAVVDADFSRIQVGAGGHFLLGTNSINVSRNPPNFPSAGTTYIRESFGNSSIGDLLRAGTRVTLHANHDMGWYGGLLITSADLAAEAQGQAGDLHIKAGGSINLGGVFSTLNGDWTLSANAPVLFDSGDYHWNFASIGMVDVDNYDWTRFVNDNGHLTLEILDGSGGHGLMADTIQLPLNYSGAALTARIDPGVAGYDEADIRLLGSIGVAGAITLDGHLRNASQYESLLTLSGSQVNWLTEKTGGRISLGHGLRFLENGVVTRFGGGGGGPTAPGVDAVRLELGSNDTFARTYGDADPDQAALDAYLLRVAAHNNQSLDTAEYELVNAPQEIPLTGILAEGSIDVSGPGVDSDVGSYSLTLQATQDIAFTPRVTESVEDEWGGCCMDGYVSGPLGSYWIDLTGGDDGSTVNMEITSRTLTVDLLNPTYTYGSPTAALVLNGIVNGDAILPVGTLNGSTAVWQARDGGFGFDAFLDAVTHSFSLTNISGDRAHNYHLDISGLSGGSLTITPKTLTYWLGSSSHVYGSPGSINSYLSGVLNNDDVSGVVGLFDGNGNAVALEQRTRVGNYVSRVLELDGSKAHNYVLTDAGSTQGSHGVTPKTITWSVANASSVYGTLATLGTASFSGVLAGDDVSGTVSVNTPQPLAFDTDAGSYQQFVSGLSGADEGNYVLAGSGHAFGTLHIERKTLTYTGSQISVVYGDGGLTLPLPTLVGVVGSDEVALDWAFAEVELLSSPQGYQPFGDYQVGDYRVGISAAKLASNPMGGLVGARQHNYVIETAGSTDSQVTVTPRPLIYTITGGQSVYGATIAPTVSLAGLIGSDQVFAPFLLSQGGQAVAGRAAVGSYVLDVSELTGAAAFNYVLADSGHVTGTWQITPKTLTWYLGNGSVVYGDVATVGHFDAFGLDGLLDGDVVLPVLALSNGGVPAVQPGVGQYDAVIANLDGAHADNYVLAGTGNTPGLLSVTPRPLTYRISDTGSVYGSLAGVGSVMFDNLAYTDAAPVGTLAVFDSFEQIVTLSERTAAGLYRVQVTALSDPNYRLADTGNVQGNIEIARKSLRFTTYDVSGVYGTQANLAAAVLNNDDLLDGDEVFVTRSVLQGIGLPDARQAVGQYRIVADGLEGAQGGNYQLVTAGSTLGSLTIDPKAITYSLALRYRNTLLGSSSTFGSLQAMYGIAASAELEGVLSGDTVTLEVQAPNLTVSSGGYYSAGTHVWSGTGLSGAQGSNYVIAGSGNQDVAHTITPIPVTVAVSLAGTNNGQVEYGLTGGLFSPMPWFVGANAGLADAHYGAGVQLADLLVDVPGLGLVPASQLPERLPVGTYQLAANGGLLTGADAGNFVASLQFNSTLRVVQKPIARIPYQQVIRQYGETLRASDLFAWSGVLPGDEVSSQVIAQNLTLGYDRNPAGTYTVFQYGALTGADAGNYRLEDPYTLTRPNTVLTIQPRLLTLHFDTASLNFVYGGYVDATPTLGGVLPGEESWVDVTAMVRSGAHDLPATALLNVGQYTYRGLLTGSGASNYRLPASSGTVIVSPRPVTAHLTVNDTVYGTYSPFTVSLDGVLPGQSLTGVSWVTDSGGAAVQYGERSPVGTYTVTVNGLAGDRPSNYVLVNDGLSRDFAVSRKPLSFTNVETEFSLVYGDGIWLATLAGILDGDDVQVSGTRNGQLITLLANEHSDLLDSRQDVGSYRYVLDSLIGADSDNYLLVAAANRVETDVTITPRPLRYWIDNVVGQYGNFKACADPLVYSSCNGNTSYWADLTVASNPWATGLELGELHFDGLMPGDDVQGKVGLIDLNGTSGSLADLPPPGLYFQVLEGELTGAQVHNYVRDETGSRGGILEITPLWVSWSTTSALFMPETGLVGTPGIPTLNNLLPGDDVRGLVQAFDPNGNVVTDWTELMPGIYEFRVVALEGDQAAYYRPLPANTLQDSGDWRFPIRSNTTGVLTVFADSRLGMGAVGGVAVPQPPQITPPPAPAPELPDMDLPDVQKELPSFGRNIDTSQFVVGTESDATSASAGGSAQGTTETSTQLGDAEVSVQASGYVAALAKAGITGVTVQVTAGAQVDINFQVGPGFVTVGAQADAMATATAGVTGVKLATEARAGAYASGGASGDLGGGATGEASVTTEAFVYASTESTLLFEDGKLKVKTEQMAGAGASVGGQAGVSGEAGSVNAGATLYTPGIVGGSFSIGGGYSDGKLSVEVDIGAAIGIGGLGISFDFSIDLGKIGKTFSCMFGGSCGPSQREIVNQANQQGADIQDPLERFAYLSANGDWNAGYGEGYHSNKAFYDEFNALIRIVQGYVNQQQRTQAEFMALLEKNPEAAIEKARQIASTDWDKALANTGANWRMDRLGLALVVQNGQMNLVAR